MPSVYVRLREGGEQDGVPVPADGRVRLTPVHVVDPSAWVTAAPTVLTVVGGVAEPVGVSAGRWQVDAVAVSWAHRWVLDLEDSADPINLATLTPVDSTLPLPWAPTGRDLIEIRSAVGETRVALDEIRELVGSGPAGPVTVAHEGDGTYRLTRNDTPVPIAHQGDGMYEIGA